MSLVLWKRQANGTVQAVGPLGVKHVSHNRETQKPLRHLPFRWSPCTVLYYSNFEYSAKRFCCTSRVERHHRLDQFQQR